MNHRSGRTAQDKFKLLCSEAEITCNSSSEDDHGWDFIIELVPQRDSGLPADKLSGPKQVLVQVKSTTGKSLKTSIKVTNALKLAKSELPCFVVLFHHAPGTEERIYIRHFWAELIERALLRGRQASAENKKLHKVSMKIGFSDQDEHSADLLSWIIATVNEYSVEYPEKKRSLCDTLGYGERNYRVEVTFSPLGGVEELVDHQLGFTDYLPVSNIKFVDSRFGIDATMPMLGSDHGRIQIRPNNARKCNLVLQNSSGDVISFEARMRGPAIPNLPPDKFKIAIETWCFTAIIFSDGNISAQITDIWNEKLSLERLSEYVTFLSWGGEEISMKIVDHDVPALIYDGKLSLSGHEGFYSELSSILGTLRGIQKLAGINTVNLTLQDLRCAFNELSGFQKILSAEDIQLCAQLDSPLKTNVKFSRILGYFDFEIGGYIFFVVFDALATDLSAGGGDIKLDCGKRVLRECFVGDDGDSIRAAGKKSYKIEEADHVDECFSFGDIRTLLQDYRIFE